jgi:hypothetical protein
MAIFAIFSAVSCLGATLVAALTTDSCDDLGRVAMTPPAGAVAAEGFPGAHAVFATLGSRGCFERTTGPALHPLPAASVPETIEAVIADRGYVPSDDPWSGRVELPWAGRAELDGGCGVVALVAEPSASIYAAAGRGLSVALCSTSAALLAACDGDELSAQGVGGARVRTFSMPGLTRAQLEPTGLDPEVSLAHAEAELRLRRAGWTPVDEIVVTPVRGGGPHVTALGPPRAPASGCIAWVAVGLGFTSGTASWAGTMVSTDPNPGVFTLGLVSCAADASGRPSETIIEVNDPEMDGGQVYFRAFAPGAGAVIPNDARRPPLTLGSVREVDASDADVPMGIARAADETSP